MACRLAAGLACLALAEGDAAGLVPFDTFYTDSPWHPRLARMLAAGGG